ncbi:MAG: hypothetical protein R3B13_24630 [Polyangiaceae bacterium]
MRIRLGSVLLGVAATLLLPRAARADVSSWLYLGGGAGTVEVPKEDRSWVPTLQLDTGIGTPPSGFLMVGGGFRMQTFFGQGSDVGLLARTATRGYVNGDFGAALDLGGYQRWWGPGSTGLMATLNLGAPWGLTLSATGGRGTNEGQHLAFTLGIDLARLTVYRRTGDRWWKNPFPAYRPEEERR